MSDWLKHFRLKADPFDPLAASLSPYLGEPFRSVVLRLEQALERRRGWIHLIGEPGVGKSTIVQAVMREFDAFATVTVSASANITERVLGGLLVGDHAPPGGSSSAAKRGMLLSVVKGARAAGRPVLVFVDDVDHAHAKDLETLRMALHVDPAIAEIVQVILAGRERFAGALQGRAARGVSSRIAVRIALSKMAPERAGEFVIGCLKSAGCKRPKETLQPDALAAIVQAGDGIAGRCAMLTREAFRRAAATGADHIDAVTVREALQVIGVASPASRSRLHLLQGRMSRYAVLATTAVAGVALLIPALQSDYHDRISAVARAAKGANASVESPAVSKVKPAVVDRREAPGGTRIAPAAEAGKASRVASSDSRPTNASKKEAAVSTKAPAIAESAVKAAGGDSAKATSPSPRAGEATVQREEPPPPIGQVAERVEPAPVRVAAVAQPAEPVRPLPGPPAADDRVMPGFSSALSLQVAAFRARGPADEVVAKLTKKQFEAVYIEEGESGERPIFRVRVGRFVDGEKMKRVEARLAASGFSWYRAPVR